MIEPKRNGCERWKTKPDQNAEQRPGNGRDERAKASNQTRDERISHATKLPEKSSAGAVRAATLPGTCCLLAISRKSQPFQAVFSIIVLNAPLSCAICR
jgi:hypothetical protein